MPFALMGPALERGTVAGAVISEPSLSAAKAAGAHVFAKTYDAIATRFLISGWFTTTDFAQKNPAALKTFAQVIYATAKWANSHHDDTAAILAKYAKLEPELIRSMTRASYAQSLEVADLQPTLDAAYKFKIIDAPVNASDVITRI